MRSLPAHGDAQELAQRKQLLLQQMALLDERCSSTSSLLAKKMRASKSRSLAAPEPQAAAAGETYAAPRRRRERPTTFHRAELPSSIVNPRLKRGGEAESLRMRQLLRKTVKSQEFEEAVRERRPFKGPVAGVFRKTKVEATMFPIRYRRGELPCSIEHRGSGNNLSWICPLLQLDYEHYLPIFLDGIRCTESPYQFVARQGFDELIEEAKGFPDCVLPCLPDLIKPIRLALNTKDPDIVHAALRALQKIVLSNYGVGEALVPFYRQLLSVMNLFFRKQGAAARSKFDVRLEGLRGVSDAEVAAHLSTPHVAGSPRATLWCPAAAPSEGRGTWPGDALPPLAAEAACPAEPAPRRERRRGPARPAAARVMDQARAISRGNRRRRRAPR